MRVNMKMRNNHGIGFVLRWARAIQLSAHCMYGSRCSWQTSAKLTPQFPTSTEQLRQQNLGEREKENIQVYILRADVWTWHHWDVCTYAHASPQHTQTTTPALVYIYIYIYIYIVCIYIYIYTYIHVYINEYNQLLNIQRGVHI